MSRSETKNGVDICRGIDVEFLNVNQPAPHHVKHASVVELSIGILYDPKFKDPSAT